VFGALPVTAARFGRVFPLPDDPALPGLQLVMQAVVGAMSGRLNFDLSNGVLLTLGR